MIYGMLGSVRLVITSFFFHDCPWTVCRYFTILYHSRGQHNTKKILAGFNEYFKRDFLVWWIIQALITRSADNHKCYLIIKKLFFNVEHFYNCVFFLPQNRYQTTLANLLVVLNLLFIIFLPLHKGIFLLPTNVNFTCCSWFNWV